MQNLEFMARKGVLLKHLQEGDTNKREPTPLAAITMHAHTSTMDVN